MFIHGITAVRQFRHWRALGVKNPCRMQKLLTNISFGCSNDSTGSFWFIRWNCHPRYYTTLPQPQTPPPPPPKWQVFTFLYINITIFHIFSHPFLLSLLSSFVFILQLLFLQCFVSFSPPLFVFFFSYVPSVCILTRTQCKRNYFSAFVAANIKQVRMSQFAKCYVFQSFICVVLTLLYH
jgi:hypothetical protein